MTTDEMPEMPRDRRLVGLNVNAMAASTKYQGEFEERMQEVFKETTEYQDELILLIDEVHTIIGTDQDDGEGRLNVASVFKPMMTHGELNLIGAATLNKHQKYIKEDATLERRFQSVTVLESTVAQTMMILCGLRNTFETHHKVNIIKDTVTATAELLDRHITTRFLPDKAIGLFD